MVGNTQDDDASRELINTKETMRDESKEKDQLESTMSPSREFKVPIDKEETEKKFKIANEEKEFINFACTLEAALIPALRRIGIRDIEGFAG